LIPDASPEQVTAWEDSIAKLQTALEPIAQGALGVGASAIFEYELPYESRRIDALLLLGRSVVVIEAKGKASPSHADLDQVNAYARDLRCYHRECAYREVVPILMPTRMRGRIARQHDPDIVGPDSLTQHLLDLRIAPPPPPVDAAAFLADGAYTPLPTLIEAARCLLRDGDLPRIKRAHAATQPAIDRISEIIHEAARTRTRRLVLLTGVPGAGKTLVGLRIVHSHFLDDLAVPRSDGTRGCPAVFLSGNAALVTVLQYELRKAGGGGKTFVRRVKDYVKHYSAKPGRVPPEHVLVFDEAQRAWDAEYARYKHKDETKLSEPAHFIEFAERVPEWCVVLGLVGGGQEINVGEEGGLGLWMEAIARSPRRAEWTVHGPPNVQSALAAVSPSSEPTLNLDSSIRFHAAIDLHRFVAELLDGSPPEELAPLGATLADAGYALRMTRDLEVGKRYLWERYRDEPARRFGLLFSSKDRDLVRYGIVRAQNRFPGDGVPVGEWYGEPQDSPMGISCRHLRIPITEFEAQGLELDAVLLAWGSDFLLKPSAAHHGSPRWSIDGSKRAQRPKAIRSASQLRQNAYRVLLTRGREAVVVFLPDERPYDLTAERLERGGFTRIDLESDPSPPG